MNELEIKSKINRLNLDEKNYFESLIKEAYNNGMITENEIINLQIDIIQLLDERVYKYNGIDNSSVRKEIVEEINKSNYYTISMYLKTFNNPDDALEKIKSTNLNNIYYIGRKKIDRILNIIRVIYAKVKQNKLKTNNQTYNDTIIGGIQGFLKIYNPDFKAHDMEITADYPLYNNLIGKLDGVEFIKEYVYSIYLENELCNFFLNEKIERLLYDYSEDYKDLIINIFEIVLFEAIACKLAKRNVYDLEITSFELNEINNLLKNKKKEEIEKMIIEAYKEICKEIIVNKKDLQEYIERNLSYVIQVIINNAKQNTLDKIFIIQKFIEN